MRGTRRNDLRAIYCVLLADLFNRIGQVRLSSTKLGRSDLRWEDDLTRSAGSIRLGPGADLKHLAHFGPLRAINPNLPGCGYKARFVLPSGRPWVETNTSPALRAGKVWVQSPPIVSCVA